MENPKPTVVEARQALKNLEVTLLEAVRQYENDYGTSIQKIDISHSLMMGDPRRVMSVRLTAHL
jgi:hypothetical protein